MAGHSKNFQPELQPNIEQRADKTISPAIANATVSCTTFD